MLLKDKSVLVIDDEIAIQESLSHTLSDHQGSVFQCTQPLNALSIIEKNHFDLVLLDIWMPDLDGMELLKQIKEKQIDLPVIILSGHANMRGNFELAKIGADDFLEKPFSTDNLLWKIEKILKKEKVSNPIPRLEEFGEHLKRKSKRPQRTLKRSQVVKGKGLHSGEMTGIIISPLPPDCGIVFEDIATGIKIEANWQNVRSTSFATHLQKGGASIQVVEHLLATFHMYEIDNALVKVNKEIPILDGSGIEFCSLLEACGFKEEREHPASEIVIDRQIVYTDPEDDTRWLKVEPYDGLYIDYFFELAKFGDQKFAMDISEKRLENFKKEIAPARTFGFMDELKDLQSAGLGRGGDLANFLLVDDDKVINQELRFPDEFARHKVLDILGDFYLLGSTIKAKITGRKTGHRHNLKLVEKIVDASAS